MTLKFKKNFYFKKIFFVFLAIFLGLAGAVFAQSSEKSSANEKISAGEKSGEKNSSEKNGENQVLNLSLNDALDFALENSKNLKSSKLDFEIAQRAKKYRWNVFFPTIQGTFTAARTTDIDSTLSQINSMAQMGAALASIGGGGAQVQAPVKKDEEKLHWALVGNVSASLNLSLAYISSIRASLKSYEIGEVSWDAAVRDLKLNVTKFFYGLLLQQESLKINEASLENARQRANQAEINFKNGSIPEIQLLQSQVNYQNQIPAVESAQVSFSQQLDTFAFLIGLPVGQKISLNGKIEPVYVELDENELLEKYAQSNSDIETLRKNIELLKLQKSALDLGIYSPALALSYNYNPTKSFFSDDSKWPDGGSFSATLAWTVSDMLPFSSKKIQSKELGSNIKKLELQLELLLQNNEIEIQKSIDSLRQAKRNIETSERNIMLAQKSYEMSSVSYKNGQTEFLDLKEAESQYNNSKIGLLNEQYNYMAILMDLEKILNTELFARE